MILKAIFEYDTEQKVATVRGVTPNLPFGTGEIHSVLHESHFIDAAQKALRESVKYAIKGEINGLLAVNKNNQILK